MGEKATWYPETERVIRLYFCNKSRLDRLRATEKTLQANLYEIQQTLGSYKRIPGLTAKYGLCIGGGNMNAGLESLMGEYEEQTEQIVKQMGKTSRRLIKIQCRRRELEEWAAPFDASIERLSREEQTLLEQRYTYRRSNYIIAELLHCSEYRVRYMLSGIITEMAGWVRPKQKAENKRTPD
ncbi:hypothetical protein [Acetonema longum]|uniref:Uncharacterized protein n=1 Tax=Acetonema longum DSM 6540 TaxID=1009370 RepID=F7NK92_9FIRM|nr:hypothetical protein [Acetonema longum]EGO63533.1 hypothetical protein ALO_12526 [Acetonema longum DSM 6540]